MWVEVINVEQSCSVEEAGENSTVIPKRLEKGAGTNSQASEEIFATDFTSVVSRPLHYRCFQPKRTMKQEDNESSAEAFIHRGKPGGGVFLSLVEECQLRKASTGLKSPFSILRDSHWNQFSITAA